MLRISLHSASLCRYSVRCLSIEARVPLQTKHAEFLKLVDGYGGGAIEKIVHDKIVEIIIDNPSKRNSITGKMMNEMASIVDEITDYDTDHGSTSSVVGIVVRGSGMAAFCAGADLNLVKNVVNTAERGALMAEFMTDALNRLRSCSLISVCCLNGPALGGGAELATCCDFRITPIFTDATNIPSNDSQAEQERVYIQFVHAKIGASPGWGGARRLVSIVGRQQAIRVCASSDRVGVADAVRIGLVDQVVVHPCGDSYITSNGSNNDSNDGVNNNVNSSSNNNDNDSVDSYMTHAAIRFLGPFIKQAYPGSVRAIKSAIASVEDSSSEDSKAVELAMFKSRWGGADNKTALRKPA